MNEKLTRTKLRLKQGSLWESFQDEGVTDEELDALLFSDAVRKKREESESKQGCVRRPRSHQGRLKY
jgi:methionine salvage enolase-phosphatase E1